MQVYEEENQTGMEDQLAIEADRPALSVLERACESAKRHPSIRLPAIPSHSRSGSRHIMDRREVWFGNIAVLRRRGDCVYPAAAGEFPGQADAAVSGRAHCSGPHAGLCGLLPLFDDPCVGLAGAVLRAIASRPGTNPAATRPSA